ncbi:hypothetical protein ACWFRJ_39445 [Streptomyces sp. NPDC055239]
MTRPFPSATEQPPDDVPVSLGIIGDRQLLCVQTFDIARHTSAAVGLIPGCFAAVSGKGPDDSNESGKTSWLAAVALLLGDPEWRMHSSGPAAVADLLFEPRTAGIGAQGYAPATTGYVAGLFADPDDVPATAHTVWVKLSATPTYVEVRHTPGVHLATAQDDIERHDEAVGLYRSLPSTSALGATQYATALYGPVPRCLAFLTSRGKRRGGPSLLKLDTGLFTPAGIGAALIELTGRGTLLDTDASLSRDLSQAEGDLETTRHDDIESHTDEERVLRTLSQRNTAREELTHAQVLWALHYARGLLDALERTDHLQSESNEHADALADARRDRQEAIAAEQAVEDPAQLVQLLQEASEAKQEAERQLGKVRADAGAERHRLGSLSQLLRKAQETAAGVRGNLEDARREALAACQQVIAAEARLTNADHIQQTAQHDLADAEEGRYGAAGKTINTLHDAGLTAVGLLDGLDLPAETRHDWEARLTLYRDAVCIARTDIPAARTALAGQPGAVLLAVPEMTGPEHASVRRFLDTLATRLHLEHTPDMAVDDALGLYVLGGFTEPITGRIALLARLRAAVEFAEQALSLARQQRDEAVAAQEHSEDLVRRLEASIRAAELRSRRQEIERELAVLQQRVAECELSLRDADTAWRDAGIAQATIEYQRGQAKNAVEQAKASEERAAKEHEDVQKQIDELDISYWQEHGRDRDTALRALHWTTASPDHGPEAERRTESRLRQHAGHHLERALDAVGVDTETGAGAPTAELEDTVRLRDNPADDTGSRRFADATAFEAPAQALQDWLDRFADSDASAADRIRQERADRADRIAFGEQTTAALRESLRTMQGGIALRLDQALQDIEDALAELNRKAGLYGVELRRTLIPPPSLQDMWRCEVTPYWRRTPNGHLLPYDNITNSAQEKLFSIHLVLAALLASPHPRGRLLILDELGDSLGSHHRQEVLSALARSAHEHGITVLGTCQESLFDDAAEHCGELLYFSYPSHTDALNAPTRMFGYDRNGDRVELTMEILLAGRSWW